MDLHISLRDKKVGECSSVVFFFKYFFVRIDHGTKSRITPVDLTTAQ